MLKTEHCVATKLLEKYDVFHCTGEICSNYVKRSIESKGKTVLDTMRIWNGGASFYTCKYGGLHWNTMVSRLQIKDGSLFASDLWNCAQLFWEVETSDNLVINDIGICKCGLIKQENDWQERDQIVQLPNGSFFDYQALRRMFVETVCAYLNCTDYEVLDHLLGINFGISDSHICVFYEFKKQVTLNIGPKNVLADSTGMGTIFKYGLQYGNFKNKRVSYTNKAESTTMLFL
jgi:hypothetical protein